MQSGCQKGNDVHHRDDDLSELGVGLLEEVNIPLTRPLAQLYLCCFIKKMMMMMKITKAYKEQKLWHWKVKDAVTNNFLDHVGNLYIRLIFINISIPLETMAVPRSTNF